MDFAAQFRTEGLVQPVPDLSSSNIEESLAYYVDLFRFEVAMDMGWVATLASPDNPTAQITIRLGKDAPDEPNMTIEVDDVVRHHIDHHTVWVSDEETAHTPLFGSHRVCDFETLLDGRRVDRVTPVERVLVF